MNEVIVKALIREFLTRKNLSDTIACFDREFKLNQSITRIEIIQALGMERIFKRNQQTPNPLKTVLEILVDYIVNKRATLSNFTITTNSEKLQDIPQKKENDSYMPSASGASRLNKMKKRPQSEYRPNSNFDRQASGTEEVSIVEEANEKWEKSPKSRPEVQPKDNSFQAKSAKDKVSPENSEKSYKPKDSSYQAKAAKEKRSPKNSEKSYKEIDISCQGKPAKEKLSPETSEKSYKLKDNSYQAKAAKEKQSPKNSEKSYKPRKPSTQRSESNQTNKDSLTYSKGSVEQPQPVISNNSEAKNLEISPQPHRPSDTHSQTDLREQKSLRQKRNSASDHKERENISNLYDQLKEEEDQVIDIEYQKADVRNPQVQVAQRFLSKVDYNKAIPFDIKKKKPASKPILQNIKKLLFQGGQISQLPESWSQGFIFQSGDTFFGLKQNEGGPCGVMAAVQAYFLKHFLFNQKEFGSSRVKQNCLVAALADIFFKVNQTQLILVTPARSTFMSQCALPIESCEQFEFTIKSYSHLYDTLLENMQTFLGSNGVAIFFYSLILTKGIDRIVQEMDSPDNPLIGNHGHCTQESVNLMLTGKATSNCFDGMREIDGLKINGIEERSEFGFLTIFEHFGYLEIGRNFKEPHIPIWVLCKEYHYSVIFGCYNNVLLDSGQLKKCLKEFDLIFYDGLNNPDDLIRLTVRRGQGTGQKRHFEIQGVKFEQNEKTTPLIELVLRCKYGALELDWNDSMPIL